MRFCLLFLGLLHTLPLWGVPLTDATIREARNIVILPGAFDPLSVAEEEAMQRLLSSGQADLVIALPSTVKGADFPLPVPHRLDILRSEFSTHSGISYPQAEESARDLLARIKALNPNVKMLKPLPVNNAFNIRKHMLENSDQYFGARATPPGELKPSVYQRILENGLYLGRSPTDRSFAAKAFFSFVNTTTRMGLFDKLRAIVVKLAAKPNVAEVILDGKTYKVERYVASGLTADAYIIEMEGEKIIVKMNKGMDKTMMAMREASLTYQWLAQKTNIAVPRLVAESPDGAWQASEFVKGQQLDEYISAQGGLSPQMEKKLQDFYSEVSRLYQGSSIKLDISADNIFIRTSDGMPVLIDFGPIQPEVSFAMSYEEAKARWVKAADALTAKSISSTAKCTPGSLREKLGALFSLSQ